jgi:tetratricopeptide (TPR) repeat protein
MTRRSLAAAALGLALAGPAGAAAADPGVSPLARQLSDRGRALHDLGDYEQAIVAYKQAYLIAPSPGLLYNLAQAYRLSGDCGEAAALYRRYLDSRPDTEARRLAEEHLAVVESCLRRGPTTFVARGQPPAVDDEPGRGKRRLGMVLAGSGAILIAAGAYFALDARSAGDQVANAYQHGGDWKTIGPIDERGQRSSEMAAGLFIAGGAAVATGVVLYLFGRHDAIEAGQPPPITIASSPRGTVVEAAWRF